MEKNDYFGLLICGIIALCASILGFLVYRWLSRASRFENRKKEIAFGVVSCVILASSLFVLPVMLSRSSDLQNFCRNFSENVLSENGKVLEFVRFWANFLLIKSRKIINLVLFGIPTVIFTAVCVMTGMIFANIREPKKIADKEYNRNHLFEYNGDILENLNKKK